MPDGLLLSGGDAKNVDGSLGSRASSLGKDSEGTKKAGFSGGLALIDEKMEALEVLQSEMILKMNSLDAKQVEMDAKLEALDARLAALDVVTDKLGKRVNVSLCSLRDRILPGLLDMKDEFLRRPSKFIGRPSESFGESSERSRRSGWD
mmetsp:Transcript_17390/g.42584  ORF Transcript_17390/g.42584 Transcript_17390/m.42584 type:complete len:149 (-) Transcript_17390:1039-1485(-)